MRIQDVMTRNVQTIAPTSAADDARTLMRTKGIRHLVVIDEGRIVGVLSDRDLGGRQTAASRTRTVRELMTPRVVTVPPDSTTRRAANLMRGRSIGCLVVATPAGRVRGIVTTADLLEFLGRGVERPIR
jgi:acetoin utilization protein AcuB